MDGIHSTCLLLTISQVRFIYFLNTLMIRSGRETEGEDGDGVGQ